MDIGSNFNREPKNYTRALSSELPVRNVHSPPKQNLAPLKSKANSTTSFNQTDLPYATLQNLRGSPRGSSFSKPILGRDSGSFVEGGLGLGSQNVDVTGKDRAKYSSVNQLGQRNQTPSNYVYAKEDSFPPFEGNESLNMSQASTPYMDYNGGSKMVDAEIQTMYRESEAQTDPYSPDFILKDDQPIPEVLYLAEMGLGYGKGLPIGQEEMKMIERARQKRNFEASLPPLSDKDSLELRKKKMEEQEELEWRYRDEEIKKAQLQRLEKVERELKQREEERELFDSQKVQSIMMRSVSRRDAILDKINRERVQTMRKIAKERENVEGKKVKRDIIEDYADHGSRVYAPMTREGRRRDPLVLQDIKPPTLASLGGIESVERKLRSRAGNRTSTTTITNGSMSTSLQTGSLTQTLTQTNTITNPQDILKYREKSKPRTTSERQEDLIKDNLDKLEQSLKAAKSDDKKLPRPSVAEKIEKPPPRPPTPSVFPPNEQEEETEQALLLLQYLIRGRAVQNLMYEGKQRRQGLVNELKAASNYRDVERPRELEQEDLKKMEIRSQQEIEQEAIKMKEIHEENLAQSILDDAIGSVIGSALDFLSKELVRSRQEKEIEIFVQIAEKTRRMREAQESGKRQIEQQLRINQDEQYRQIMEVHQSTAATYFDDILEDAALEIKGREEIALKRAQEIEEQRLASLPTSPDDVINDLVFGYLFPLVEEKSSKEQATLDKHKYRKAAWSAVDLVIPDITKGVSSQ